MRAAFFHSTPLVCGNDGQVYSIGFTYDIWKRYLAVFDKLIVSTRMRFVDTKITDMKLSSGPRVEFKPISNYSKNTDIIINKRKIVKQIRETLKLCDCAIIRLPSFIGYIAIKEAIIMKKPYLIEVVGCAWGALWNHSLKGKLIALPSYLTMKKAVKNAPYALYVSNKFLQQRYPCNGKTVSCSDVSLPSINDDSLLIRRINKINQMTKDKPIVLGTVAAVNVRYKGQQYVIKAISKLNKEGYNFEYHLVGGGDKSYLKSIAEKYNVADKVKFLGTLPHEKIFDYLDNIDIYIQPSKQEGLPRALIEAMSRGCPSLGSKVGGIPELINNDLVFQKGSVHEICELLKRMYQKVMIEEAKRNFEKAKEYDRNLLNIRRVSFFMEFVEGISAKND